MLYFKFKNYEEFKEVFGTRVANNGKKVRSNHILLSFLKHEFKCKRYWMLECMSIGRMESHILNEVESYCGSKALANGVYVYSNDYRIDNMKGICEDGDTKCIRYVRKDNGRIYKMKAGKFMRNVLESCRLTNKYCEQAIIYVCERFAEDWSAYVTANYGRYPELHVDDNFEAIYDIASCKGNFDSCMSGREHYPFYENAVKAKAAYLTDEEGFIVARCVIFTEVHDADTGAVYRLAERQYASDGDDTLKLTLVNKLIAAGEIDGYKRIGADCRSSRSFLLNDGTSIQGSSLWIDCDLDFDDTISYQDSFKYYDMDLKRADNYGYGCYDLAVTESYLEGSWDEYHQEYCRRTVDVYVWNSYRNTYILSTCNEDDLEDFYQYNGDWYDECVYSDYDCAWYPRNIVVKSEFHDSYLLEDDAQWCDEAEDYFSYYNFDVDFDNWKKGNWEWDEFNGEYAYETILAHVWNDEQYDTMFVGRDYVVTYFKLYDGEWYSVLNDEGIPFHLVQELEAV